MPRERLTDTRIANLRPTKEMYLRDTESHLAVRARATGSKVFVFMSTLRYKDIRIAIGEVGALSLPDARRKAQAWCHRPAHRSQLMIGTMEPARDRHIEARA